LAQGGVPAWLDHVRGMAMNWFYRLKPAHGFPEAWIEPAGNGWSIIEAARERNFNPNEIDSKFVAMGKDGRPLAVEPRAAAGQLKIGRTALDRRSSYRGVTANHLVRQVTGFRAFDKDAAKREDDLFDSAMYAASCRSETGPRTSGRGLGGWLSGQAGGFPIAARPGVAVIR
jgi:hypothetical protein